MSLTFGLLLGVLLGMRHSFEPDHVAAVSTLIDGRSRHSTTILGAFWGIGHSTALLAVGGVLAALHASLPRSLGDGFELLVAAMLVILGARAVARAPSGSGHLRGTPPSRQLARIERRARLSRALALVTGTFSVGLGGWWGRTAFSSLLRG